MKKNLGLILIIFSIFIQTNAYSFQNQELELTNARMQILKFKYDELMQNFHTIQNANADLKKQNNQLENNFELFKNELLNQNDKIIKNIKFLENNITKNNNTINNIQELQATKHKEILEEISKIATKQINFINDVRNYKNNMQTENKSLKKEILLNTRAIKKTTNDFDVKIKNTHKNISDNKIYWIIATLILTIFIIILFILLKKQLFKQKNNLEENLKNTRIKLEEEGIKLDNKLIDILDKQLKIADSKDDHSLALKVADEIIRIQKNISNMDKKQEV